MIFFGATDETSGGGGGRANGRVGDDGESNTSGRDWAGGWNSNLGSGDGWHDLAPPIGKLIGLSLKTDSAVPGRVDGVDSNESSDDAPP